MNELEKQVYERTKTQGFMVYNHIEMEQVEPDWSVFRLEIRPESRNIFGMVHGGALYALADNAAGSAAHTDGRSYVTQSGSMNFLRNQAEGVIRAEARVRHRGGSTVLVGVDITGEGGKLLATGEYTFFCVDGTRMKASLQQEEQL